MRHLQLIASLISLKYYYPSGASQTPTSFPLLIFRLRSQLSDALIARGFHYIYVRQYFQMIGMVGPAVGLSALVYLPLQTPFSAVALLTLTLCLNALTVAGVSVFHLDFAPEVYWRFHFNIYALIYFYIYKYIYI